MLGDSYILMDEEHGADRTRRGMIVLKGGRVVMYILICLQRIDEEEMETLTSQWVGDHYNLKEGALGVLCCLGFESQLLKVEVTTPCDGTALVTPFKRSILNDKGLEETIQFGILSWSL